MQAIASVLRECFASYGIADKAFHATTDNGANMVNAISVLGCLHTRCFAHSLQLLVNKALDGHDDLISKAKAFVGIFHHSTNNADKLRTLAAALRLPISELKQCEPTRWQATFYMLDSIVQLWPAIKVLQDDTKSHSKQKAELVVPLEKQLSPDDITLLERLTVTLAPYAAITRSVRAVTVWFVPDYQCVQLEGENYPTLNLVLPCWMLLVEKAEEKVMLNKPESKLCGRLMDEMDKRMPLVSSKATVIACQLDPRFRQLNFFSDEDRKRGQEWLREEFVAARKRVPSASKPVAINPLQPPSSSVKLKGSSAASETAQAKKSAGSEGRTANGKGSGSASSGQGSGSASQGKSEKSSTPPAPPISTLSGPTKRPASALLQTAQEHTIKRAKLLEQAVKEFGDRKDMILIHDELKDYLAMPSVPADQDPLVWWRANKSRFPTLANVARAFLCIPATSAPSERVFSTAGNIITEKRARLSDRTAEALILCHENIDICKEVANDLCSELKHEGLCATAAGSRRLFDPVLLPGQNPTAPTESTGTQRSVKTEHAASSSSSTKKTPGPTGTAGVTTPGPDSAAPSEMDLTQEEYE